jgi:hypothetical protein
MLILCLIFAEKSIIFHQNLSIVSIYHLNKGGGDE